MVKKMAPCKGTTRRGLPCKRPASKGSAFCFIHGPRPGDLPRTDVVRDVTEFVGMAADDLLTLAVIKAQYCDKQVSEDIRKRMKRLEFILKRILHGSKGPPPIPGLQNILRNPAMSGKGLILMRRKFVGVFRELTGLMVEHCKIKGANFTLPELRIDVKVSGTLKGCGDIPEGLLRWFRDVDDALWRDKQVLCLAGHNGRRVNLPEGHMLTENFVVVSNVDNGKWYGVARRKQDNWSQRLLELLKRKCKEALLEIAKTLWSIITSTALPIVAMMAWRRLLVIMCTAVLTKNTWLLQALPRTMVALSGKVLGAVFALARQAALRKHGAPTPSQAVALWFALNIATDVCPFIPHRQLALPPGRKLLQIAPPPPSHLPVPAGGGHPPSFIGPWRDMDSYMQLLVGGAAVVLTAFVRINFEAWLGPGVVEYFSSLGDVADTISSYV